MQAAEQYTCRPAEVSTEAESLRKDKDKPGCWSYRELRILLASHVGIMGIVMGTFCYTALMPSLEADESLGWSPRDTAHLATLANAGSTVGLFAAGPMADHFRPSLLLSCNALVLVIGLIALSMAGGKTQVTGFICLLTIARGVMWPGSNVILSANLVSAKHDVSILSAALGSRIGDVISPMIIGVSLQVFLLSWRWSLLMVDIAVLFLCLLTLGIKPPDMREPDTQPHMTLGSGVDKFVRLVTDLDGWLVFVGSLGTYGVWALYDYAAVLLADIYALSPGEAANSAAFISAGSAVGLTLAFFASSQLGSTGGRTVHVLQSMMAVAALTILSQVQVSLTWARTLLFVVGFGFAAVTYVPYLVYAGRSRADERAFRAAVVDGTAQFISIGYTYVYGMLRASQGAQAAPTIFLIASVLMAVATLNLIVFYRRLHFREEAEHRSELKPSEADSAPEAICA